jgi:hypothetical protein
MLYSNNRVVEVDAHFNVMILIGLLLHQSCFVLRMRRRKGVIVRQILEVYYMMRGVFVYIVGPG